MILPLCAPLLLLAALAPLAPWQGAWRARAAAIASQSVPVVIGLGILVFLLADAHRIPAFLGVALAAILLVGVVHYMGRLRAALPKGAPLTRLPMRRVGSVMGHLGLAIFTVGLVSTGLFKTVMEQPMRPGETMRAGAYALAFESMAAIPRDNYLARQATLTLSRGDRAIATLTPETRLYPVRNQETTESSLHSTVWRDVVAVMGRANYARSAAHDTSEAVGVRLYIIPGQWAIWLGFIFASLGSLLAAISGLKRQGDTHG